jgi:prepilin-type N-terminal cleavage/methylation domain-containing protein
MGTVMARLRNRVQRGDEGMTLIELMISMMLFTVLLGVFMSAIVTMTKDTTRVRASADSSDEVRRAYQLLDKQVHYAVAVNRPGVVSGKQFIEFQTTAVVNGAQPQCTQWRFDPTTMQLAYRTWSDVATGATATAWAVVANRVTNNVTTSPVFTFLPVDENFVKQRVQVFLDVKDTSGKGAQLRSTFVAINTTSTTLTTQADGAGNSKFPVCQQVARS